MAVVEGTSAGFVTSAPSSDPAGSNGTTDATCWACKFTSPAGTNAISLMGWYCDNATEDVNYQLGIYSHDATNNRPNALLASSGDIAKGTSAGWKTGDVTYDLAESTVYWLTEQLDDPATTTYMNYTTDAGYKSDIKSGTALPATWGSSGNTFGRIAAIYALYAAAGGGGSYTAAGSLSSTGALSRMIHVARTYAGELMEWTKQLFSGWRQYVFNSMAQNFSEGR